MLPKPLMPLFLVLLMFSTLGAAPPKKSPAKTSGGPDQALLQKIWDGWSTLDPENTAQYYAQGPHTFFDIAPLKYSSWDEYQKGVVNVLADFKSAKLTVNDDAEIHTIGDHAWGYSTVKEDAVMKSGKREMGTFRWTFVFEKQNGKWLLVHEHISEPLH